MKSAKRAGRCVLPALFFALLAGSGIDASASDLSGEDIESFLERHWDRPLSPQGEPPEDFTDIEADLAPQTCGICHIPQYEDWQTTWHAHSMGPGVLGQLVDSPIANTGGRQACLRCHAPLAEQAASLTAAIAGTERPDGDKPPLHEQGLVCAACHVRNHERFGPPRSDGSPPPPGDVLPHNGFTVSKAYQDSLFCAACHQFTPDQFALNGKLLENTYEEWKASRYAEEGRHCQSCHMPDRRHLWRGIHDPDMVRQAVSFQPVAPEYQAGKLRAELIIRNTGTGHHFPTYVTPRVIAEIVQVDANGNELQQTMVSHRISREVPVNLSREISDTRLPAGEEVRIEYDRPRVDGAKALVYRLRVEPDEFYVRFYRATLANGGPGPKGEAMIREALAHAESSPFVAFEEQLLIAP